MTHQKKFGKGGIPEADALATVSYPGVKRKAQQMLNATEEGDSVIGDSRVEGSIARGSQGYSPAGGPREYGSAAHTKKEGSLAGYE